MNDHAFDLIAAMGLYPATALCIRCGGLLADAHSRCAICGNALLEPTEDSAQLPAAFRTLEGRLDQFNCRLRVAGGDAVTPVRDWAQIERLFQATRFLSLAIPPPVAARQRRCPEHTAMGKYLNLLATATQFIHFNTFGISEVFVGFLKALSYRSGVSVRGVITNPDPASIDLLTSVGDAPDFEAHVFVHDRSRPAQLTELVIIDGLVALDGAAMMQPAQWRTLVRDRQSLRLLTDAQAIVQLNNTAFAPWFGASSLIEGWNVYDARRKMVGRTWSWPA